MVRFARRKRETAVHRHRARVHQKTKSVSPAQKLKGDRLLAETKEDEGWQMSGWL